MLCVLYVEHPLQELYQELIPGHGQNFCISNGNHNYRLLLTRLSRFDLLIIVDWGISPITVNEVRELLDRIDESVGTWLFGYLLSTTTIQ